MKQPYNFSCSTYITTFPNDYASSIQSHVIFQFFLIVSGCRTAKMMTRSQIWLLELDLGTYSALQKYNG